MEILQYTLNQESSNDEKKRANSKNRSEYNFKRKMVALPKYANY